MIPPAAAAGKLSCLAFGRAVRRILMSLGGESALREIVLDRPPPRFSPGMRRLVAGPARKLLHNAPTAPLQLAIARLLARIDEAPLVELIALWRAVPQSGVRSGILGILRATPAVDLGRLVHSMLLGDLAGHVRRHVLSCSTFRDLLLLPNADRCRLVPEILHSVPPAEAPELLLAVVDVDWPGRDDVPAPMKTLDPTVCAVIPAQRRHSLGQVAPVSEATVDLLRTATRHRTPRIRRAAVELLARAAAADRGARRHTPDIAARLSDTDPSVRAAAAAALMSGRCRWSGIDRYRSALRPLAHQLGADTPLTPFIRAVVEQRGRDSLQLVTLGAKIGAGTPAKRTAPPTTDAAALAGWLCAERDGMAGSVQRPAPSVEVQLSVGWDPGECARTIALYLFIATTRLQCFQALNQRPARDPGAAFGILIRGAVVAELVPGQCTSKRLDFIFQLGQDESHAQVSATVTQFQLLCLGMLAAHGLADAERKRPESDFLPFMDERIAGAAWEYRRFERSLVRKLRDHDPYRTRADVPDRVPAADAMRSAACATPLEVCLYPTCQWIVPLHGGPDTLWPKLVTHLRAVEAAMVNQRPSPHSEADDRTVYTRGDRFITEVRELGEVHAGRIRDIVAGRGAIAATPARDPFIDMAPSYVAHTRRYLINMTGALRTNRLTRQQLPDQREFDGALRLLGIDRCINPPCKRA